jgi:hypothetical protein
MKRDASHKQQIELWAKFVRDNPNWKKQFKKFSDAQIIIARKAYQKLAQTEEGRKKIKLLREMR